MQIRKRYGNINPQLLYDEVRDFTLKQGAVLSDASMETYSSATDSSSFISRGTLTFRMPGGPGIALTVHVVGSGNSATKLMLDVDDAVFPADKLAALQDDLHFVFGSNESNLEQS